MLVYDRQWVHWIESGSRVFPSISQDDLWQDALFQVEVAKYILVTYLSTAGMHRQERREIVNLQKTRWLVSELCSLLSAGFFRMSTHFAVNDAPAVFRVRVLCNLLIGEYILCGRGHFVRLAWTETGDKWARMGFMRLLVWLMVDCGVGGWVAQSHAKEQSEHSEAHLTPAHSPT